MTTQTPAGRLRLHPTSEAPEGYGAVTAREEAAPMPPATIGTIINAQDALLERLLHIETSVARVGYVLDGAAPTPSRTSQDETPDASGAIDAAMLRLSDMTSTCARIEAYIVCINARLG